VPCGIAEFPVTSLARLGIDEPKIRFDAALRENFAIFLNDMSRESTQA
jgi:lipoyl(octanoyl) transferase